MIIDLLLVFFMVLLFSGGILGLCHLNYRAGVDKGYADRAAGKDKEY